MSWEALFAAGPDALRAHGRQLAGRGEKDALREGARWAREHRPASEGLPWAGALLALAGDAAAAVETYQQWLPDAEAPPAWHVMQLVRAQARLGDGAGAFAAARHLHPWDLDADALAAIGRTLERVRKGGVPEGLASLRVALLGTFNTTPLLRPLRAGAARLGLDLELYEADFDQLHLEVANPASALYAHRPDVVVLASGGHDLRDGEPIEAQADAWAALWDTLVQRTEAHVLQHAFTRGSHEALGHVGLRQADGRPRRLHQLNEALAARLSDRVTLVDVERAALAAGADRWTDDRQWAWAKEAVAPAGAPHLVEEYLAVFAALTGRTRKVLVLDLDNTLWGGIVGEDGPGGLRIGPPSVEGESHLALQRYALELKRRGVLLAVCSKNNPEDARAPFEQLDDMAIGLEDLAAFHASWTPKPVVIEQIAAELNLGLDSFVFLDDNPAERAGMRHRHPEVLTVPLGDDASEYVARLDAARAFEVLSLSEEDAVRASRYVDAARRQQAAASAGSEQEFLASLEMQAVVRPFSDADRTRIVQLAGRSNQFNLTTWRLTAADVDRLIASPTHGTFTVRLSDRYGEYGLVALLVGESDGTALTITAWAMSCRVLGRSVEQLVLAELESLALGLGCSELIGVYLPTQKNVLVEGLYERLGFEPVEHDGEGTRWRQAVDAEQRTTHPYIQATHPDEDTGS